MINLGSPAAPAVLPTRRPRLCLPRKFRFHLNKWLLLTKSANLLLLLAAREWKKKQPKKKRKQGGGVGPAAVKTDILTRRSSRGGVGVAAGERGGLLNSVE